MANNGHAYVVQRTTEEKGMHYVVVVDGEDVFEADTQEEAADWAKEEKYPTHVARVRHLQNVDMPNHWRKYK